MRVILFRKWDGGDGGTVSLQRKKQAEGFVGPVRITDQGMP